MSANPNLLAINLINLAKKTTFDFFIKRLK